MIVVSVVAGTTIAVTLLLASVDVIAPRDHVELIKTSFAIGAGIAGVAALVLAGRRQWALEQANRAAEQDAVERRITELDTKVADQLGSDKAPVRLVGLYALERLAQDNPNQRQTIVNVLCAYLRIPFEPSPEATPKRSLWNVSKRQRPAVAAHGRHDPEEELLVRQTVQNILSDHVFTTHTSTEWPRRSVPPEPTFWPDIDLDLRGATLVNFMLQGVVRDANFSNVRFIGTATFAHASFDRHVYFSGARFEGGHAHFFGTWFGLRTGFVDTDFGPDEAVFKEATFMA